MNQAMHLAAYPVTDACIGGVDEFEYTQPRIYGIDNPYLHGIYAPTTIQLNESGLRVESELPGDLVGTYFRNGPNPVHQTGLYENYLSPRRQWGYRVLLAGTAVHSLPPC